MTDPTITVAGEWAEQAECKGATSAFYQTGRRSERAAIAICHTCPVQQECLEMALDNVELFGVWGGTTPQQRLGIRRRSGRSKGIRLAPCGTVGGHSAHKRYGETVCPACYAAQQRYTANYRATRKDGAA